MRPSIGPQETQERLCKDQMRESSCRWPQGVTGGAEGSQVVSDLFLHKDKCSFADCRMLYGSQWANLGAELGPLSVNFRADFWTDFNQNLEQILSKI
jgi:hypothetical protein